MNTQNQTFTPKQFDRLHQIGDQIERIAEKLKKTSGNEAVCDELYQLGDEVEHFCDQMKSGFSASDVSTSDISKSM